MARNRTKILCFIFGGILLLSLFMMSPFYIDMSWKKVNINQDHINKKYVTLANFLNLNQSSQLSVFIIFTDDDLKQLPHDIPHHKILYSNNDNLIKQLLNASFFNTGGDLTTVCSKIVICQDRKKIFEAQILLSNENIGLQSSEIGWIEAVNTKTLIKIISRFDIYKYPILII